MNAQQDRQRFRNCRTVGCVAVLLLQFRVCAGQPFTADFNGDSKVSGTDGLVWQRGYGIVTGASHSQGDANGDMSVNGADLAIFKFQLNDGDATLFSSSGTDVVLWLQIYEATRTFKLLAQTNDFHGIAGIDIAIKNAATIDFDPLVWPGLMVQSTFTIPGGLNVFSMQDLGGNVVPGVGFGEFRQLASGTYLAAPLLPDFGHDGGGAGYSVNLLTGIGRSARSAGTQSMVTVEPPPFFGDYNNDNVVDAADYVVWRETDGTQPGYNTWRANFGRTVGVGTGAANVPEPAALWITTIWVVAILGRLRVRVELNP